MYRKWKEVDKGREGELVGGDDFSRGKNKGSDPNLWMRRAQVQLRRKG